ncbi:putative transmembrane glycoprotein [Aspergillus stella-maris]|uniref:putative transmembrane glycoprotein n=1 Tax=Aspergillus stella-maris TaxID=1810926 RepID=UPI003CCE2835
MAYLALVFLSFLVAVNAAVVANYPVNAQLPPVARVSQPFIFVFSQGTFGGSDSKTAYSLLNAPSWLKVDSASRTLSGTPEKKDAGSPKFDLIATDPAGSASMEVTLIVTADEGPTAGKPLAPQLQAMGPTSSPSNIMVHSGDSFSFSFDPETFINTHPSTIYYGTSYPENAPLPSWIRFDQSSLRFYGTAPIIGPQTFSLNMVASDVSGFSATTMTFELTISPHILSFNQSAQTLFVDEGKELASPHFIDTLTLDGVNPTNDALVGTKIDAPDWLEVDKQSLSFKGTPPADGKNSNVTITVRDSYQDVATLVVSLHYSQFFRDEFDDECDAVIGEFFTFTFNNSALTNDSTELDVEFDQKLSWLHYNRDNKTLHGEVPSDSNPDSYRIQLTAREGTAEGNKSFTINTVDGEDSDGESASGGSSGSHTSKAGIIVMAIFIPLGCIAIILFLFYCRRRRQQATEEKDLEGSDEKDVPPRPVDPQLSHCQPFDRTNRGDPPAMMNNPAPESPPKLELEPWWNANSDARENDNNQTAAPGQGNTFSSSAIDWEFTPLRGFEQDENKPPGDSAAPKPTRLSFQSSPPVRRGPSNRSQRREPLKPIQPRRSMKRNSAMSSRSKRWSKRSSGISSVSNGLPVRLSGAGHGAGGFGPPGHGFVKLSWQNTQASLQSEESNLGNLAPLFPRPPLRNNQEAKRVSMRTVERDSLTISESDSLEAFVQGRARSRHSSNPFIAGGTGRRVSSSLRALERAQSTASRSDTIDSSLDNDESRRRERPWSQAMSGSVYTDDYRHSAYLSSLSEESPNVKPLGTLTNGPSQLSLAQHYSKIISPLPRFFSELSLNNTRRDDAGGAHAVDGLQSPPDTRRWSRSNPSLQNWRRHRKSPSTSSISYDAKPRRVSLMRAEEQNSSYRRGLREPTGSLLSSDIAFV